MKNKQFIIVCMDTIPHYVCRDVACRVSAKEIDYVLKDAACHVSTKEIDYVLKDAACHVSTKETTYQSRNSKFIKSLNS